MNGYGNLPSAAVLVDFQNQNVNLSGQSESYI